MIRKECMCVLMMVIMYVLTLGVMDVMRSVVKKRGVCCRIFCGWVVVVDGTHHSDNGELAPRTKPHAL